MRLSIIILVAILCSCGTEPQPSLSIIELVKLEAKKASNEHYQIERIVLTNKGDTIITEHITITHTITDSGILEQERYDSVYWYGRNFMDTVCASEEGSHNTKTKLILFDTTNIITLPSRYKYPEYFLDTFKYVNVSPDDSMLVLKYYSPMIDGSNNLYWAPRLGFIYSQYYDWGMDLFKVINSSSLDKLHLYQLLTNDIIADSAFSMPLGHRYYDRMQEATKPPSNSWK